MAGSERSPTSAGKKRSPVATSSPIAATDGTFDLLTGIFPPSNPFVHERLELNGADRNMTLPSTAAQIGGVGASEPTPKNLMYNYQEPVDLLTGMFSTLPLSTTNSPRFSPTPVTSDGLGPRILARGAFESDSNDVSIEFFEAPQSANNNPFVGSVYSPPAHSAPALHPISQRLYDVAVMTSQSSTDACMHTSFVKSPSVSEKMPIADLGGRPHSANGEGISASTTRMPKIQSAGSRDSPASPTSVHSAPLSTDSVTTSNLSGSLSSISSGGGYDRMHNGPSRGKSSSSTSQSSVSPPPTTKNSGKNTSVSLYDHWMPSVACISSRLAGKETIVLKTLKSTSTSSSRTDAAYDEYVGVLGKGIYKSPARGAVHPKRPVSLELRPHPLRGAPINQITVLVCLERSVWAVCDLGLMVWDIENATGARSIAARKNLGDEDAAAYDILRCQGSPASCIAADVANDAVWTGHRDGKIRLWFARASPNASRESRSTSLSSQAFAHAVTAIFFTPYGELWAGSESGEIKVWPWKVVAKAMSGVNNGTVLTEESCKDLKIGSIAVGPNGPINPEVRFLVGDHAHGTVWCAGSQFIAIWDARTMECLKVLVAPNGFDLNSVDVGCNGRETLLDEDLKVGYAKVSSRKDKGGWLQRSRNAVMGAADAVRRAASGVTQGFEESRKLEALVAAADGTIWGGYGNGVLAQWDWEGSRIRDVHNRPVGVRSLCVVGNRLWVGYLDGKLQVLAADTGKLVGSWLAHRRAVINMAICGGYLFSLGLSGSIRGWNISSPNRDLDEIMKAAMTNRADSYTRQEHLQVLVCTWNTAQEKASLHSTRSWLAPAAEASVVVVGLQEVEMGAGAIGMAAVKETVGMGLEKRSTTGHWWLTFLDNVLGEGKEFERVGSRQLAGILLGVWIRRELLPYVGDIEFGAVACGFGRTLGNKGAVGVKLLIFRRTICVLTSHLAAHMEHVSRRNADFGHIYQQMTFGRGMRTNVTVVANAAAGISSAVQNILRGGNNTRRVSIVADQDFIDREAQLKLDLDTAGEEIGLPELADADLLIWTGDLNYRIDCLSYEEIISLISEKRWDILLSNDQLRCEMGNGRTFQGLREGAIRFPPTYKFDKGTT